MKSSCLKSICVLEMILGVAALADIRQPNSRFLQPLVEISNTGDYPDKVFIVREDYPGSQPVQFYRLQDGDTIKLGYKFDRVNLYWADASDWTWLRDSIGVQDAWAQQESRSKWTGTSGMKNGDKTILHPISQEMQVTPFWVHEEDSLLGVTRTYILGDWEHGGSVALAESTSIYTGGRAVATQMGTVMWPPSSGIKGHAGKQSAPAWASFSSDRHILRLVPKHSGVTEISLCNAQGQRRILSRASLKATEAYALVLPALASGRYLVSLASPQESQSIWLDY